MERTLLTGKAFKFGDNINTDIISPAQYMEMDRAQIAAHAMEGADPEFSKKIRRGDMVVAGSNFGSGSSRETAPAALKDCGASVVIARFFARIFYRNCINIGLPVLICEQADEIGDQDELEVELSAGRIRDLTTGKEFRCAPLPGHILELIEAGGLIDYIKKRRAVVGDAP